MLQQIKIKTHTSSKSRESETKQNSKVYTIFSSSEDKEENTPESVTLREEYQKKWCIG